MRFVYHGFRYAVVKGLRQAPKPEDAVACVIHTAFPTIGSFACSDATFNALMEMGDKAYRGNFVDGVPTDCPHREKNGMDEGDIIEIRRTPIDPMETTSELMKRLSHIAAELACDTARAIEAGTAGRTPQEESKATYAPMLSKAMIICFSLIVIVFSVLPRAVPVARGIWPPCVGRWGSPSWPSWRPGRRRSAAYACPHG